MDDFFQTDFDALGFEQEPEPIKQSTKINRETRKGTYVCSDEYKTKISQSKKGKKLTKQTLAIAVKKRNETLIKKYGVPYVIMSKDAITRAANKRRGQKRSKETIAKMQSSKPKKYKRVYVMTAEHRAKIAASRRGRKLSELQLAAVRAAAIARRGSKMPREAVERAAASRRGFKHTAETRARMSAIANKRKPRKYSLESRLRMSEAQRKIWMTKRKKSNKE